MPHPSAGERGPTPLLWRACRPHFQVTCGQWLGEPFSVLRAVPLGAPGPGAPVRVHVPVIYSPPPAPVAAHHGALEDNRPPPHHPLSSPPRCSRWLPVWPLNSVLAPLQWDIWVLLLREQEILWYFALGMWGAFLLPCWPWAVTQGTGGQLCPPLPSRSNSTFLMDPVHIRMYVCICMYVCVYVYMCVCVWPWPQWGAVQLFEGGDTERQFRRNPGGREQNQGPWSCHLMWPLLPPDGRSRCPRFRAPSFGCRAVDLHDCASV